MTTSKLVGILLLLMLVSVLARQGLPGSTIDSFAFLSDTQPSNANTFTADVLDPPTGLSATLQESEEPSILLAWTASQDDYATGYQLFRNESLLTNVATACEGSNCSYADSDGLVADQEYCYQVRTVFDPDGNNVPNFLSTFSSEACADVPGGGEPATATLFPDLDKLNTTGGGNDWSTDDDQPCAPLTSTCADAIDEDIDDASSDYIFNGAASNEQAQFEMTDAPGDLQTLTSIQARASASNQGTSHGCTLTLTVFTSDNTQLGSDNGSFTANVGEVSFTVDQLALAANDVDGLYVQVENASGTRCRVYEVNLDIEYTTS